MNIKEELAELEKMTTGELTERYVELVGEPVRTRHRAYLVRKIAWRLQANAEGDLTERARRRAAELADDADVRLMPPKPQVLERETAFKVRTVKAGTAKDVRVPPPGTVLKKVYRGGTLLVTVEKRGFEYEGKLYKTLTAVAKAISGSHVNGFRFFGLGGVQ